MKQKMYNKSAPRNEVKTKKVAVRNLDSNLLSRPVHEVGLARLSEVVKEYCKGRSTGRITRISQTMLDAEFVVDAGNAGIYKFSSTFPLSVIKETKLVGGTIFIDAYKNIIV